MKHQTISFGCSSLSINQLRRFLSSATASAETPADLKPRLKNSGRYYIARHRIVWNAGKGRLDVGKVASIHFAYQTSRELEAAISDPGSIFILSIRKGKRVVVTVRPPEAQAWAQDKKPKPRKEKPQEKKSQPQKKAAPAQRVPAMQVVGYARRDAMVARMGFETYADYLKSELWQGIRRRKLAKYPACAVCRRKATEIHHWSYDEATLRGESILNLVSLCHSCHEDIEFDDTGKKTTLEGANERLNSLLREVRGQGTPRLPRPEADSWTDTDRQADAHLRSINSTTE